MIKHILLVFDLYFNMDSTEFISKYYNQCDLPVMFTEEWLKECKELYNKHSLPENKCYIGSNIHKNKNHINTYNFIWELSKQAKHHDIIIPSSSGSASEITQQAFQVKSGQRVICSPNLGSMGFGLPSAIGACIASGKRRTIAIIGDGCLQHNIQELELIRRYDLPIKLFVLANNGYGSIRATQNKFFNGNLSGCDVTSGITLPHISKISSAYNLGHTCLFNEMELEFGIEIFLAKDYLHVCELRIDPNMLTIPRVQSSLVNGKMISGKLENMFPYIGE